MKTNQFLMMTVLSLLLAFATGCATSGQKYSEMRTTVGEPASGQGRIYVYRTAVVGAAVQPQIKINGAAIGKATPKGFHKFEGAAGTYEIMTATEVKRKLSLTLESGQTRYVRLNIGMGFFVGHVYPELVENSTGEKEIQKCRYVGR